MEQVAISCLVPLTAAPPALAAIGIQENNTAVPGQTTILASSWAFIVASITLVLQFVLIYLGPGQLYYGAEPASWVMDTPQLINGVGIVTTFFWFLGFVLLVDWIVFHTFPVFGPSRRALCGATLKLVASVFFCVQPWSGLVDKGYGQVGVGVPWSNFVGIVFFHTGNCVDAVGMASLFNRKEPFSWANLPVWGMWTYCTATWFLIVADGMGYFAIQGEFGPNSHPAVNQHFICPGQIIGSSLLLVGSLIYTYWASFPPPPQTAADGDGLDEKLVAP